MRLKSWPSPARPKKQSANPHVVIISGQTESKKASENVCPFRRLRGKWRKKPVQYCSDKNNVRSIRVPIWFVAPNLLDIIEPQICTHFKHCYFTVDEQSEQRVNSVQ